MAAKNQRPTFYAVRSLSFHYSNLAEQPIQRCTQYSVEIRIVMEKVQRVERSPLLFISVQKSLKEYILDNKLTPGAPLPSEGDLSKLLGVGRNSLREAVKALESIGLLETRRGQGIFVGEFSLESLLENIPFDMSRSIKDVAEVLDLRRILEVNLIPRVVGEIQPEDLNELKRILERMRTKAERGEEFSAEDKEFHNALYQCIGNTLLLRLMDIFWEVFYKWEVSYKRAGLSSLYTGEPMATYRDHVAIVEALEKKEPDVAQTRMDSHYEGITRRITKQSGRFHADK